MCLPLIFHVYHMCLHLIFHVFNMCLHLRSSMCFMNMQESKFINKTLMSNINCKAKITIFLTNSNTIYRCVNWSSTSISTWLFTINDWNYVVFCLNLHSQFLKKNCQSFFFSVLIHTSYLSIWTIINILTFKCKGVFLIEYKICNVKSE